MAKVKTYLYSWGTMRIMDGAKASGVVFESKSGRQAIMAKVVIDSTGDGDLLPYSGATFDVDIDPGLRIANLSLSYWINNVNYIKADDFRKTNPAKWTELMQELMQKGGHPFFMRSNLKNQENIVWVHPRYATSSQTDVEELTRVEFLGRDKMLLTHEFYKKHIPGFEDSFIVLSGPQLGTRGARRVHGDYMVTSKDLLSNEPFEDTIAIFPDLDRGEASLAHPNTFIPYRALLPKGVENMLVGRTLWHWLFKGSPVPLPECASRAMEPGKPWLPAAYCVSCALSLPVFILSCGNCTWLMEFCSDWAEVFAACWR